MTKRVVAYVVVALATGSLGLLSMGPRSCGIYGFCTGGDNTTPHMWFWGATVGVVVGLVAVAVVDIALNGGYLLANRTEAKARRRRAEAEHENL